MTGIETKDLHGYRLSWRRRSSTRPSAPFPRTLRRDSAFFRQTRHWDFLLDAETHSWMLRPNSSSDIARARSRGTAFATDGVTVSPARQGDLRGDSRSVPLTLSEVHRW